MTDTVTSKYKPGDLVVSRYNRGIYKVINIDKIDYYNGFPRIYYNLEKVITGTNKVLRTGLKAYSAFEGWLGPATEEIDKIRKVHNYLTTKYTVVPGGEWDTNYFICPAEYKEQVYQWFYEDFPWHEDPDWAPPMWLVPVDFEALEFYLE